jgi:hypothetical protein
MMFMLYTAIYSRAAEYAMRQFHTKIMILGLSNMSIRTPRDWKLVRKRFFIAFASSVLLGLLAFFASALFAEEQQDIVLLAAAGLLWVICAGVALRSIPLLDIIAVAAGLVWGFLFSLSAAISIQNAGVSVNWRRMIPGLLLIPPIVAVAVFPFWFFSAVRRHRIRVQALTTHRDFWGAVSVGYSLAIGLNVLPYLRTRGAYQMDGFEVIGFPFVFSSEGGFAYRLSFHWWALLADILLATLFAFALGLVWSTIRRGDLRNSDA